MQIENEGGQVWSSKWSQILDCSQSGGWLFYKLHRKSYFMLHMRNNHTNSSNRYTRSTASHWCDWYSFLMCLFCKIVKVIIFVKRVIIHTLHINCWVCFVNKLTRKGVLIVFIRSRPADLLTLGPHQAFCSGPYCRGGIGGPYLDWASTGWYQQWEELRCHEGLRTEQTG